MCIYIHVYTCTDTRTHTHIWGGTLNYFHCHQASVPVIGTFCTSSGNPAVLYRQTLSNVSEEEEEEIISSFLFWIQFVFWIQELSCHLFPHSDHTSQRFRALDLQEQHLQSGFHWEPHPGGTLHFGCLPVPIFLEVCKNEVYACLDEEKIRFTKLKL